jgi:RNA polymerase sigma-70 factor (ECF subfamily)
METSVSQCDPSQWLEKHGDVLYSYAISRLRNPDAAEEVVQEAFLGAIRNISQYRNDGAEGAWLMGILKRKVIDRLRADAKKEEHLDGDDQVVAGLFDDRGNWSFAARKSSELRLDSIEQREFHEILARCLQHLPQNQAAVFIQREVEEKTTDVICKELGITSTNLWVLMHRARLRLVECIKARWEMGEA